MWRRVGYPITKYANTVQCNLVFAASTWENGRGRRRIGDEVNKFKIWIKLKTTKSLRPQLKSRHFCAGESCPAHNVLSLCDCIAERLWGLPTHPSSPVSVLPDRWVYTSLWASIDYMLHFNNWSCFPTRALNKTNYQMTLRKGQIFDTTECFCYCYGCVFYFAASLAPYAC